MYRSQGFFSKTKPCGTSATTQRCSTRYCWTEPAFPGRTATPGRTARFGCTSSWSRHRQSSTAAARAPPQPLERHANLPGIGVQRFDRSAQAGPGQARPHPAELPGGRKTHSVEILEYVFESLARSLLLVIQEYYESEDGKKAFAEWKAKKENTDCAST